VPSVAQTFLNGPSPHHGLCSASPAAAREAPASPPGFPSHTSQRRWSRPVRPDAPNGHEDQAGTKAEQFSLLRASLRRVLQEKQRMKMV